MLIVIKRKHEALSNAFLSPLALAAWLLVIGYLLLVIGYWLLVICYWLLVIGYWLFVIRYLLFVIKRKHEALSNAFLTPSTLEALAKKACSCFTLHGDCCSEQSLVQGSCCLVIGYCYKTKT